LLTGGPGPFTRMIASAKRLARAVLPAPLYHSYRKRRVRFEIRRFRPRVLKHTYGQHDLVIRIEDPLGEGWYDRDWPQLAEIDFLSEHLRPGARVFELGAHQAVLALMLARTVAPGPVIAVEAEPHNAQLAQHNRDLNDARNLTIVNAAAADRPGMIRFTEGLNGHVAETSKWGTVNVPAVTIDQLAHKYGAPHAVFLDIEGYEFKALLGAPRTLKRRPAWFLEVHTPALVGASVGELLAMFCEYRLYAAATGEDRQFLPLHECRHLTADRFFLVALP
jgi:FkbM family methyltransferase